MKKAMSLLLALVMCLSLCACGQGSQEETQKTVPTENNQIETNTTESTTAVDESDITEVPEETKAPVIVELTLDNWSEYLEFTSRYEPSVNGFDEVDDVKFYFDICLKEEYLETLDTKNSTITVEISFTRGTQYGTFSEDFKTFTPDGEYDKWEGAEKTEIYDFSLGSYGFGACYTLASADFENSSFGPFYPSEQTVLRVSGTLVFN